MLGHGSWGDYRDWVAAIVAALYAVTGIRFAFGGTWARRAMAVLIVIAALYFVDMILMAGFVGNRALMHWMVAALLFAAYTGAFIFVSAAWRWGRSDES